MFAFEVEEMPGISPDLAVHKLAVDPKKKPVRQKKRNHGEERSQAAATEVKKLLDAGFIRQCYYPDWVANVVLVKKPNGTWRMCVDYTDLNRACPKDSYPLPKIDHLVDSTAGHALMSFNGCLLRLPSDTLVEERPREDGFRHRSRAILLHGDAVWVEECACYFPANDELGLL